MELCPFGEVQALQFNHVVLFPTINYMNTLINCQSIDLPIFVIDMSPERRKAVRAECYCLWSLSISLEIDFFTPHVISLFSGSLVPVVSALTHHSILYTIQQSISILL